MRAARETLVTAERRGNASLGPLGPRNASGPAGVWTLDGDAIVASDGDGPATVLVPSEAVLLLAVDLPLANRAKRLAALPFAIEDRIAEPLDAVHLALGIEVAPKRYLVGVVRHDRMAEWIARIDAAGLDHAALVPDALALPVPGDGAWAVELGDRRAVVRASDGTGFAVPAAMLRAAWDAAGRPSAVGYGAALPQDMSAGNDVLDGDPLGRRLLAPALDLRQGRYARRRSAVSDVGRRLVQLAVLGVGAHVLIAAADTLALRTIADRRAQETRQLVATMAPGTSMTDDNLATGVADLLPAAGGGGRNALLPAVTRISAALAPLGGGIAADNMRLDGRMVTIDLAPGDAGLAGQIRGALAGAGIDATVAATPGGIRITAPAA